MTVLDLLEQPCNKCHNINKVVTSCSQLVDNLGQAVRTQLVGRLVTRCEIFRVYIAGGVEARYSHVTEIRQIQ